jgi:hypothetical protein
MLSATDKIELIFSNDEAVRLILVVESGEWEHPDALYQLQDKVNAAASYALDGQMTEEYPQHQGKQVEIVVRPVDEAPEQVRVFVEHAAAVLAADGLKVELKQLPDREPIAA